MTMAMAAMMAVLLVVFGPINRVMINLDIFVRMLMIVKSEVLRA